MKPHPAVGPYLINTMHKCVRTTYHELAAQAGVGEGITFALDDSTAATLVTDAIIWDVAKIVVADGDG